MVIEDITEENTVTSGENKKPSKEVNGTQRESNGGGHAQGIKTDVDGLQALRDDPEAIRFNTIPNYCLMCCCFICLSPNYHLKRNINQRILFLLHVDDLCNFLFLFILSLACRTFQNFISRTDPDTLAALSGGKAGEMSPDMFKTASSMISKMSPEEIKKMVQTASSFKGDNPFASTAPSAESGFTPTPDMLKLASDMMNKMSPEERESMFNMASSLKANAPVSTSYRDAEASEPRESLGASGINSFVGESSSSGNSFMAPRSGFEPSIPSAAPADLQEQMRNQMKDPAMRQVWSFSVYVLPIQET